MTAMGGFEQARDLAQVDAAGADVVVQSSEIVLLAALRQ
jgi:hypothetical protein